MKREESKINKIRESLESQFDFKETLPQLSSADSKEELIDKLAKVVEFIIESDFERFLSIMYRLDISEEKLKLALSSEHGNNYRNVAILIIQREEEKARWRKKYRSS